MDVLGFPSKKVELSVVVPVFNEVDNIAPLMLEINESLAKLNYEVIFVDDGSTDGTPLQVKALASPCVTLVMLNRNYGQSTALTAGIDYARGEYIALLDGDLQNDPADIPYMLNKLKREDWDVIAGNRSKRHDFALMRKFPSRVANAIIRHYTGIKIKDYGCTLKVFKADIAHRLDMYGELHRFIPVLASLQGARITQVDVLHHHRRAGKSKYGIGRTVKVVSDLLFMLFLQRYLCKPMHLFGRAGLTLLAPGIAILGYFFVAKIMGADIWGKPLLLLGVLLVILGVLFIMMGIMTELLVRIYYGTGKRQQYRVREVDGCAKRYTEELSCQNA